MTFPETSPEEQVRRCHLTMREQIEIMWAECVTERPYLPPKSLNPPSIQALTEDLTGLTQIQLIVMIAKLREDLYDMRANLPAVDELFTAIEDSQEIDEARAFTDRVWARAMQKTNP